MRALSSSSSAFCTAPLRSSSCRATKPMDRATTKLYKPSPTPILYVAPCDLMLGRVPLFPCFLQGNATPTIPLHLLHLKASAFQFGIADAAETQSLWMAVGGATCMRSTWLWQFGRGRSRLGGLFVSETEEQREAVVRAESKRSQETLRRREAARRGDD